MLKVEVEKGAIMENAPRKILVIEDDVRLFSSIQDFLKPHGFQVHSLMSGEGLLAALAEIRPSIVLLDVMLPGEDGFSILQRLRAVSNVPVIMITARGEETDRVVGLELGADDYLAKPLSPRELLARIKAVLRRSAPTFPGGQSAQSGPAEAESRPAAQQFSFGAFNGENLEVDGFILDATRQSLLHGRKKVRLSTAEFCVLYALMSHAGKVLAREQLIALAFNRDNYATERNIDGYISRLRKILRELGDVGLRLRTIWGSGYCWVKDGAEV